MADDSGRERKREQPEAVEVVCPKCRSTQIVYLPMEEVPKCPDCRVEMLVSEILTEGKYY
ncbi:hypothetical protein [Salidesulfovibrio brasiliensis]|uniref:hypothetical protein n=1 Tax=Salidesulfovibrio brasiliensis TaxID=221711 RepID=UPI0006D05545|nr:hypothetical protein [Salidesulfovibrio brasiliensis]